jgi:hypothetical protein
MARAIKIFWENDFSNVQANALQRVKARIDQENQNYLLNVNEEDYLAHIASEFRIEPLSIDFGGVEASFSEKMIPAERFPPTFHVFAGRSYPKQVVSYHIPFSGDPRLLQCAPSPRVMNTFQVEVESDTVCFELINFSDDPERIRREADSIISLMRTQYLSLSAQVERFNSSLITNTKTAFDSRRAQVMKQQQFISSLGVPIKKSENVLKTFAIPATRKPIHLPRPSASTRPYAPEPTLDDTIYNDILQVIHDTGTMFERLPSTYADKDEESLRDHLIMNLEPRFELTSTTGETFNKSGKTDILMRYDKKNIFVAECKFWSGKKNHFETIDQLLSYLTWRDSKAAVVYFVPTKEMTAPLKSIQDSTPEHPAFLVAKGQRHESWFYYDFHLPDDRNRIVHVAILCFHLPRS